MVQITANELAVDFSIQHEGLGELSDSEIEPYPNKPNRYGIKAGEGRRSDWFPELKENAPATDQTK